MAVVLDTRTLTPSDRIEAIDAAMRFATVPSDVALENAAPQVHSRIELWDFGPDAAFMRQFGSGMRITRGQQELRAAAPERIALTLLSPGSWQYRQHGRDEAVKTVRSHMVLTDLSAPNDYVRMGSGGAHCYLVDFARLGVSTDVIRAAVPRLESSPLYPLVQNHLRQLSKAVDTSSEQTRTMLGSATTELTRALVLSASGHGVTADANSLLTTQIKTYVRQHFADPDLTPERIAAVHNLSVRQVYNRWSDPVYTLNRWVILQRLEAAKGELENPICRGTTLEALSRRVGFVNPSHFSRRFKERYGMSPGEYQRYISHASH